MAHDVFISHSSKDKTVADAVCAVLESNGVRCWISPRDVIPSVPYAACIVEAIEQCRIMVLVFTMNANNSPHIAREIERAANQGKAILPLRVEDVVPARGLDYFIGNVHWLDALTPPLENHLKNLASTVKMLLAQMPTHKTPENAPPNETPFEGTARAAGLQMAARNPLTPAPSHEPTRSTVDAQSTAPTAIGPAQPVAGIKTPAPSSGMHSQTPLTGRKKNWSALLVAVIATSALVGIAALIRHYNDQVRAREEAEMKRSGEEFNATLTKNYSRPAAQSTPAVDTPPGTQGSPVTDGVPDSVLSGANNGNADDQYALGYRFYYAKDGIARDYSQAAMWFRRAADQGNRDAQAYLGDMYQHAEGVPRDYEQALLWSRKAADQGVIFAQYNVGDMYYNGHGVPRDYSQALVWFQKAADQKFNESESKLGFMYAHGYGVDRDYARALYWYKEAADGGVTAAQYNLGDMYEKGLGVQKDLMQARNWYQKAAHGGDADAQKKLKSLDRVH